MSRVIQAPSARLSLPQAFGLSAAVSLVLILAALPFVVDKYWLSLMIGIFLWIGIASAWNFMAGAGYVSLAVGAWYGLGAYSTAVLMNRFNAGFYVAAVISAIWIGLFAVLMSMPLLRLRSHYFIMGSFIIAEVLRLLMKQVRVLGLSGGLPVQLPVAYPGDPDAYTNYFYFVALLFSVLTLIVLWTVRGRRIGFALRAIGQDESMAEMLGVATTRYKLTAFGLSSSIIALAGSITGYWVGYLEVDTFFSLVVSIKAIVTVVLGGIGTLLGPVLGVTIIQYIEQRLGPELADISQIVYGLIVAVVIVALPRGLISPILDALKTLTTKRNGAGDTVDFTTPGARADEAEPPKVYQP